MSSGQIKILCVNVKQSEPLGKVKSKVLKGMRKAEKKTPTPVCVSQPLQSWTKDLHSLPDIPAGEVAQVVSNSRYIVFLLKNGSVCRLKCTSVPSTGEKSVLDSLQRSTPTFQELSDAEYARQLQSEMLRDRSTGDRAFRVHSPQPSYTPEEDMERVDDVIYIGTLFERNPDFYSNLAIAPADITVPPSNPVSSSPLTARPSRRAPLASKREKLQVQVGWPDIGTLEWGPQGSKFVSVATLHSEILLVDTERKLYSWRCDSVTGVTTHPLTASLGLEGERVCLVEGGEVRASLVTESGKLATFYDSMLRDVPGKGCPPLISSLSHSVKTFPEFKDDPVTSLSVASFITTATTASGRVFWWGLSPKSVSHSSRSSGSQMRGMISDGSLVKLKDGPPCGPNTIVYTNSPTGTPLLGKTVSERSVQSPRSSVLVKVYKDTPLEGQSSTSSASPILKDIESSSHFESLDIWKVSDVVFLDDSPAVMGRVVTVDQHQAIVDVSGEATSSKSTLKVFKTSELELCLNTVSQTTTPTPSDQHTSQHIAGVVQHTPLLLSTPSELEEDSPKSVINGYHPLALHTTSSGPSLLLNRTSDGQAFIACSAQASHGPFGTSSFVALDLGSKPVRCTVSEESVSTIEGGLASHAGQTQSQIEGGLTSRAGRAPSFVSCHNSQLLFLKDVNGQLLSLTDGLKLRPDSSLGSKTGLSAAYNCVHSRSYSLDKDQSAVLVVLVPRAKQLLSCVLSGDLTSVQTYLSSLEAGGQKRKHLSEDEPPSKKPRLESAASNEETAVPKQQGGDPCSSEGPSSSKRLRLDSDPEPKSKITLETATEESGVSEKVEIPSTVEELYECTVHNSNALHVCCELHGTGDDEHVTVSSPDPLPSGCGSERRILILDTLLNCQHIRPHILKLLCSKNGFGHTPFLSAISRQNYDAALHIFGFVTSLSDQDLVQAALLSPSSNGITPLTQLFASLSSTFDLTSCQLLVTNIPSGYRAQSLLRLFQMRYPSVYKVVISRDDADDMGSDSSGDEEGGEGMSNMMRSRVRGRRHLPYSYPTSSSASLRGVVYFSDVRQLRSALVEMQGHKLSVGPTRGNTGFGQSQQTNHLVIQLADSEEDSGQSSAPPGYQDSSSSKQGGTCRSGEDLLSGTKHSRPRFAHTLLTKLLSLDGVSATQGEARETTLSSIVHNTKCLEALSQIKKGQNPSSESTGDPTPSEAPPTSTGHSLESVTSLLPYTSLSDYLSSLSQVMRNINTPADSLTEGASSSSAQLHVDTLTRPPALSVSDSHLVLPTTLTKSKGPSVCSCHSKDWDTDGRDMLQPLVSDWPCLVATILGFYPKETQSDSGYRFCSVHSLDSFMSNLLLNCEMETVIVVTDTIVKRMNEAIPLADLADLSLLSNDIDWLRPQSLKISQKNVALIAGRRFVESAVRVLAMNHSRPGNVASTQQTRQEGGRIQDSTDGPPQSRASGGQSSQQGNSSKEFSQAIWCVLSRFSWLSVGALIQAAEASIAPVRLGVAKPLGASSVTSEYQQAPPYGYMPSSYSRRSSAVGNSAPSLSRVVHTRTALNRREKPSETTHPSLPTYGVVLTPSHSVGGVSGEGVESDVEMSDMDEPSRLPNSQEPNMEQNMFHIQPQSVPFQSFPFSLDLDTDHSDDEDFPLPGMGAYQGEVYHFGGGDTAGQSEDSDEERLEDIYPYAWALDGRRIGETSSAGGSHQNVMANITLGSAEAMIPLASIPSIRFGSGFLARTFARLIKDMVDVAKQVCEGQTTETTVSLPPAVCQLLIEQGLITMDKTWFWVASVLDVAEGQLQRGEQFDTERHVMLLRTGGRQNGNGRRTGRTSRSFVGSNPSEYIAFLVRSHTNEDQQSLPVLDLYGYEHVVYCLDGLLYVLTHLPKKVQSFTRTSSSEETPSAADNQEGAFFNRTESVIVSADEEVKRSNDQFFGEEKEVFTRPVETYPLAKQPHLLQPYAEREQLFGGGVTEGSEKVEKKLLPVSYSRNDSSVSGSITTSWTTDKVHKRWSTAISVFAHIFLAEGPGGERSNFLNSKAGFASRMARFRHQVAQLYNEHQMSRDWSRTVSNTFSIRVRRDNLLQDSLDMLYAMSRFHYSSVRVKFEGEDGSGPGVNRGFFASLANDLINSDITKPPINQLGRLLHQPGKLPEQLGTYAPCPFVPPLSTPQAKISVLKAQRRSAFLSIGRFLGLCLWFKYTIPLTLCRHVAKFLLGRDIAWHDLAFYNADLYEGMRRMIVDTKMDKKDSEEFLATYCCYFEAPLSGQFSEPVLVDLIPGGSKIPVTPSRVHEYVRLYAMFTMVGCVKEELEAMKEGLNDVVPPNLLSSLTAEDFQLLLSGGSMDISVARLKTVIRFNHTHRGSSQFKQNFERMFWRVVKHMNNTQRQQLLYFATGSASLPATSDASNADTPIAITIDVINTSDMDSLPVASTCSQRMSLPLYPSYTILKKKLLQAIQCQAYGLG